MSEVTSNNDAALAKKIQKMADQEQSDAQFALQLQKEEMKDGTEDDLRYITSHLDDSKILWSSHPEVFPPTLGYQPKEDSVVNTFFIQSPQGVDKDDISIWSKQIEEAVKMINNSDSILIIAGAGIGVDSGLPDYRGPEGFWKAYPALAKLKLSLEEISHPDWFKTDPQAAWGFYAHRAMLYHQAIPHEGFFILKELVTKIKNNNYFIFTSNIDNQFQKTGFPEEKIYECHGSLSYLQCSEFKEDDCLENVWKFELNEFPPVNQNTLRIKSKSIIPKCPHCSSIARPNVSMFGDTDDSWISIRSENQKKLLKDWLASVKSKEKSKLAIIEIGCGTSLHSISIEAEALVSEEHNHNMKLIRINPNNSKVPEGHVGIGLGSKSALKEISKKILPNFVPPQIKVDMKEETETVLPPKGKRKQNFDEEFQAEENLKQETETGVRRSGRVKKPNSSLSDYLLDVE